MPPTSNMDKEAGAGPGSTDPHHDNTAAATELGHHYAEQARAAVASGAAAARDVANRVGEQTGPAIAKIAETAEDLANRTREQAASAAQTVYDRGARAGQYVTRNVHEYPATALLVAAAVGYGLSYLIHGGGRSLRWGRHEYRNRHGKGAD